MSGINFATLIGHVGADPEIRATRGGGKVATFSLATSESWRDKASGERKQRTEWHRIVIFSERLVELVEKYVRKGAKLYITGAIRARKYEDKQKIDRYVTEIVLSGFNESIVLLDKADSTRPPPAGDVADYGSGDSRAPQEGSGPVGGDAGGAAPRARPDPDDEIPF